MPQREDSPQKHILMRFEILRHFGISVFFVDFLAPRAPWDCYWGPRTAETVFLFFVGVAVEPPSVIWDRPIWKAQALDRSLPCKRGHC